MRRILLFLFICFACFLGAQTDSSLLLKPERLTDKDIVTRGQGREKLKTISATRTVEEIDQLPFSVWVVTAEDISRNGFITLGDVLRAAPGVRVSQPGNALEGETFMLRGLPGNQYVKVMINDVPIKPAAALGMPIGAQLPIRQAERIEIFYGPSATLYGDGACGGVINIILKETERPIFTQADLAFGNLGYNSLDLMLGGKLFKDQKVFRFSLYGSSTVRQSTDIFYDDQLFTTKNYLPFGLDSSVYYNRLNYRSRESGDSVIRTAPVSHESRLLGINLTWRGMRFNYNRLQRVDHSSLGLSPLAVSYANPSNRVAEQIETFAFSFQKRRTRRTATNTFSIVRYKIDNNSSFTPVFDRLSAAMFYTKIPDIQTVDQQQLILEDLYQRYASNERYYTANGIDGRFESRVDATLRPNLYLNTGIQTNFGGGVPLSGYFLGPLDINVIGETEIESPKPFRAGSDGGLDLQLYAQLYYRGKKLTVVGGSAVNLAVLYGVDYAPRLALQYRPDSAWSFKVSYAGAFRRPSVYGRVNSYYIDIDSRPFPSAELNGNLLVSTEQIRQAELGIRRYWEDFTADLQFFYQEGRNMARNGYLVKTDFGWQYGFANSPGLGLQLWGIQGAFGNDILNFDLKQKNAAPGESTITAKLEYYCQYSRGREWFGHGLPATNDVRNFPRWISQFRLSLRAPKWNFMVSSNRQNGIQSSSAVYGDFYQRNTVINRYPAYRTWDFMLRVYLSKHFLLYLHGQNIFNRHYAGIDATGTPDDLLYNPQQGRQLRFGVNYNMN